MAAFHDRVGSLILLSNGRKTAQRQQASEDYGNGTVFSAKPLRNEQLFEVEIDQKVAYFHVFHVIHSLLLYIFITFLLSLARYRKQ